MKLLCLIDSLSSGGAQRQICTLAALLKKQGMDVSVVTYHPHDFFLPLLREAGVEHTCIESRSLARRILAIRRLLRQGDQDVVLAFLEGPVLYAELAALPSRKWGLVVSERNAVPTARRSRTAWLRRLHRIADYVTTNSHTNRLMIERDVPTLKDRIVTIYNAVDLTAFTPSSLPCEDGRFRIVVAGSYWRQKNPARFVEAIAIARGLCREIDIQLDWHGKSPARKDGSPDTTVYEEACAAARSQGLDQCVRLGGDRAPIQDAYREADAVALPSLFEGIPNTICEAMACGRPILMSRVCDADSLVRDGYNGFLFDPLSPESMARAIVRMAGLPRAEREVFGRRGREMAERMLNPEVVAARYAAVLTAAASRRRIRMEHWIPDVPESAYLSLS